MNASNRSSKSNLALQQLLVGASLSVAVIGAAQAGSTSLFEARDLASGYAVAIAGDGKTGGEHACGEGGCGAMGGDTGKDDGKKTDADKSGKPAPAPAPKS